MVASFYYPTGIAVDSQGNVYVADQYNNRIRMIGPSGTVSTLAGSGNAAFSDGDGMAASFYRPVGITVDSDGTVYVADTVNMRIRKISPSGTVSTLAGSGNAGYSDGEGTAASFDHPTGVAVYSDGTVYVADQYNHRIRMIDRSGNVTTLAGSGSPMFADGDGVAASFYYPAGVAVDSNTIVYVADSANHRIRKITSLGNVSTLAGSGSTAFSDGEGLAASFYYPTGVAVDSDGTLFVADYLNNRIRKISPSGNVTTFAGSGNAGYSDGEGLEASFSYPFGVSVDSNGIVYIADSGNQKIRKIAYFLKAIKSSSTLIQTLVYSLEYSRRSFFTLTNSSTSSLGKLPFHSIVIFCSGWFSLSFLFQLITILPSLHLYKLLLTAIPL